MSDLVNALQEASGGGGSLPKPVVVNPLAAMAGAAQTAQSIYGVREKQAEQAIGAILQQATDANGNVDYQKAHTLAAQAGPVVQMGMQNMALNAARLRGSQLDQAQKHMANIGVASLTLVNDPSDANLEMVRQNLLRSGYPADVINKEIDAARSLSPEDRRKWAYQHGLTAMDPGGAMNRTAGQTTMGQFGGTSAPVTTFQPSPYGPGGVNVGGGIGHTPSPETYYTPQSAPIMLDANGQPTTDPTKAVRSVPRDIPRGPAMGMPPPGSIGPGGGGPGAAPPAAAPSGGLPPGAPPPPAGTTTLRGGRFVTPAPAATPAASAPPSGGGVVTGMPTGTEKSTETDITTYKADQANYPAVQTRAQNMAHAYDALLQLKAATGKGAQGINTLRSWAQTLGIAPAGTIKEQELFELVTKYTEREMINAAGGSTTDMGRRMQEQANAGTLLSTPANIEILRNDMGKTLQTMAAYSDHKDKSGTGYLEGRAKVAESTDPRGFVWSMYSPEEQAKINAEVDKDPDAAAKLHKAIGMARRLKLQVPGSGAPPPPQKQSFLAPPGPAPNLLQMTG